MNGTACSCRTARQGQSCRPLNTRINEAIASPEVRERFEQLNIETRATTPEEFGAYVRDQMERWGKIVKDANIKLG
jgi:tripartite-type tricarboxylate transporter receptor subunit TctC